MQPNAQLPEWLPLKWKAQNKPLHVAKLITPFWKEDVHGIWRRLYQNELTCFELFWGSIHGPRQFS